MNVLIMKWINPLITIELKINFDFLVPGCSMDGTDFPGNDLGHPILGTVDYLDCQKHCQANQDCIGSTWIQPWNWFGGGSCFLKTSMLIKDMKNQPGTIFVPKFCLESEL